jgi:SAM-dependent methyltransferase
MSIKIDDICCKHWLIDNTITDMILTCPNVNTANEQIFEVFPPHAVMKIKYSIHNDAIQRNDFKKYASFIAKTNQPEHSTATFQKLIKEFDEEKMEPIQITYDSKLGKNIITDGVHRAAILLNKGKTSIPLSKLNIKFDDKTIQRLKKLLCATVGHNKYNGWVNATIYGYHSFNIHNFAVQGQRKPLERINIFREHLDFTGKSVVDFGCNNGGMLLHLPEIAIGVGFDYDENCINVATEFAKVLSYNNTLKFFKQDLNDFCFSRDVPYQGVDIVFLLALGSWIKNWRGLYEECIKHCKHIVLEINNVDEGVPQLAFFEEKGCTLKMIIEKSLDDTTGNHRRQTFVITTPQ